MATMDESNASYTHSFHSFSASSQPDVVTIAFHNPTTYHRLSRSLNDLDLIMKKNDIAGLGAHYHIYSTSSFDSNWIPARPLEPPNPPPVRIPTPSGLPPFGSWEATLLRLERRLWSRTSLTLRQWLRSHDESCEQDVTPMNAQVDRISPVCSPQSQPQRPHDGHPDPRDLLRRTLVAIGMSRVLDPNTIERASLSNPHTSPHEQAPSSVSKIVLPPWVYMANRPGPLARAHDGTFVRGSFGLRFSGHGIGERNIEDLPLARMEKTDPEPAEIPATLVALRRTDATSGHRSASAIGPAMEEEEESKCDSCCAKFCMWIWGIPASGMMA
ncbi:hypothetical protein A1O7_09605 [Cladophialophora yegresii CBS 114405]|uniref:Uncharacterized protein n=1 Tax=Cladophialophora yegresii CBS 114405 TaxID=1182544 RepID=W9VF63_9EURO|nr:uncharacterized protein A1O7_09605 [Cladophialophora yegresii CBS 114405]EXJ54267.1 hypothetical protein A1O7_09605 [Cladophialophora yegresii CBS 114405]